MILKKDDIVPADCRIIETESRFGQFTVSEALITGFSGENNEDLVEKNAIEQNRNILKSPNMVFMGTKVMQGQAKALVVATGLNTYCGKINAFYATGDVKYSYLEEDLNKASNYIVATTIVMGIVLLIFSFIFQQTAVNSVRVCVGFMVANLPVSFLIFSGLGTYIVRR